MEYALHSDPRMAGSGRTPATEVLADLGNSYVAMTYTRVGGAADLAFTPEFSSSLDAAGFTPSLFATISVADNGDGSETVTVRDSVPLGGTEGARFTRLRTCL